MTDARPVRAKVLGPKPPSTLQIFGQDLGTFLRIASSPVAPFDDVPPHVAAGMSIAEFAAWAGVDRRRLARHLIEVAAGPVRALPPGKVRSAYLARRGEFFCVTCSVRARARPEATAMPLVLKKRIQVQPVGRRGIDRSICYVTGEITDAERRKLCGVLFPVASRVDALKTHAELLKMARQACADDTQAEFLDALDRRVRTKDWGPLFCKLAWEWHDTCVVGAGRRESEVESTKSIITLHLEPAFG
jgi:hypothetical protein